MSRKRNKKVLIVFAAILILSLLAAYVLPFTVSAETGGNLYTQEAPGTGDTGGAGTGTGDGTDTGTDPDTTTPTPPTPEPEPEPEPAMSLVIKGAPASMTVGDTVTLTYDLRNAKDDITVIWSTSDASVATIDTSGKLTAVGAGNVEIIAVAGDVKDNIVITVKDTPPSGIEILIKESGYPIKDGKVAIKLDTVLHLDARLLPDGAKLSTDSTIKWKVSDANVLELSDNLELIGKSKGEATITVTAGELTGTLIVTVKEGGISTPLLILIIIAIIAIIAGIILLISYRKKKEAEEKVKRKRAAEERRRREVRIREEGRAEGTQEGYIRGYKETSPGLAEEVDRSTKIYGQVVGANGEEVFPLSGEEKPFELDDIE